MSVAKLVWAALSIALAIGVNHQLRPRFEVPYERDEAPEPAGTLVLDRPAGPLEIPTLAAHVVIAEIEHIGKVFSVREVSLRSAGASASAPSFELFARLPDAAGLVPGGGAAPAELREIELPVAPAGRLGARESYVIQAGSSRQRILTGSVMFTDLRSAADGGKDEFDAAARIELQVETEHGADLVTGKWSGRVRWE